MIRGEELSEPINDLNDFDSNKFSNIWQLNIWDLERAVVINAIYNFKLFSNDISFKLFSKPNYRFIWQILRTLSEEKIEWDYVIVFAKIKDHFFEREEEKSSILGYLEYEHIEILSNYEKSVLSPHMQEAYFQRLKQEFKDAIIKKTFRDMGYSELADHISENIKIESFNFCLQQNLDLCHDAGISVSKRSLVNGYQDILKNIEEKRDTQGVVCNVGNLDNYTNGFQKSKVYLLAARPSMGKSALCMNIAINAAKTKKNIYFRALEENHESIFRRILAYLSRVNFEHIQKGILVPSEIEKIKKADKIIKELHDFITLDDSDRETAEQFCDRIERLAKKTPYDLIIIDHLMEFRYSKTELRHQEVNDTIKRVREMSRRLKVPVLCASQLNRKVEDRKDQRPIMSDLQDSGGLEQSADTIIFLHRDKTYQSLDPTKTELLIQKNRDGRCGMVHLKFLAEYMAFESDSNLSNNISETPVWGSVEDHPDFN